MLTFDTFYPSDIQISGSTLLLNIETTGLSPRSAFVFMIGLGWMENNGWHFRCLLAEKRMDERKLMAAFQEILTGYHQVLTYGGHSFTYRFLEERWRNYSDSDSFSSDEENRLFTNIRQLDIQKSLASCKHLLSLTDIKKDTVEHFVHYSRTEHTAPKELIKCYTAWELSGDSQLQTQLISHHEADMIGLLSLYSLMAYVQFFKGEFDAIQHCETDGSFCSFTLSLKAAVPVPIQISGEYFSLSLSKNTAILRIPLFLGELKYFLPGPAKDYYYLPKEDQAVHRSVACYVDKAYRQKATAATCYVRQSGIFLPAVDTSLQPCFREAYDSTHFYILYDTNRFEEHPEDLKHYLSILLKKSLVH